METTERLAELRHATRAVVCADCGKCTARCPLAAWGTYSPRAITMEHMEEGFREDGIGLRRCLTCGSCEAYCPQSVRFNDFVQKLREFSSPGDGEFACPHGGALQSVMRMMAKNGTQQDRTAWLDDDLKTETEKGDVVYWTGCAMYYDAFFSYLGIATLEGSRSAVRLMNRLGVKPVVSPEERCCGHDLLWSGDRENFERLARHNVKLLADAGAEVLVTSCAECLRTWKVDYEPFFKGKPPRMLHITEFLAERLPELSFRANGPRRVTFQDPCRLGRHLGVYDAPRQVLGSLPGLELAEMRRSRAAATCCAGAWSYCDGCAKQIQVERLREARATGAEVLVTACPKCQIHFRCAMKDPRLEDEIRIEMRDVAELVAEALAP